MTFTEFSIERWGPNWGLCRATERTRARYSRCVSKSEYAKAERDYRRLHTAEAMRGYGFPPTELGQCAASMFQALDAIRNMAPTDKNDAAELFAVIKAMAAIEVEKART